MRREAERVKVQILAETKKRPRAARASADPYAHARRKREAAEREAQRLEEERRLEFEEQGRRYLDEKERRIRYAPYSELTPREKEIAFDNGWTVDLVAQAEEQGPGEGEHLDAAIETEKHNRGVETSLRRIFRRPDRRLSGRLGVPRC
jgi:hypothetical protein